MFNYFDRDKIEAEFPGAYMIPPMLAWKLPKNKQDAREKVFESGEYFAELKIDGNCFTVEHTLDGNIYMFSRTVSRGNGLLVEKSNRVPHLVEFFKKHLPKGTVIAIELFEPGGKSKDVTTIIGCLPMKAIERQEKKGYLKAYVHDLLVFNNQSTMNVGALDRVSMVNDLFKIAVEDNKIIALAQPIFEDFNDILAQYWRLGYEGLILKHKNSEYSPGKRPAWSWIKFKQEEAFDILCIGFLPPTKEYTGKELENWKYYEDDIRVTKPYANGWVGSLMMGCYKDGQIINIGSVASGLSDKVLMDIKDNPNDYLYKPMLVRAMETTKDFKLREPKFIQFRDDINSSDCEFNKIFK